MEDPDNTWMIIGVSVGAGVLVCFIILLSCIYKHGCFRSRNTSVTKDVEAKGSKEKGCEDKVKDMPDENENQKIPEQDDCKQTSNARTNSETRADIEHSHVNTSDKIGKSKQNGTVPSDSSEKEVTEGDDSKEKRISVIYAKPDKHRSPKKETNASDNEYEMQASKGEDKIVPSSSDLATLDQPSEPITETISADGNSPTSPEVLYAKPIKKIDENAPSSQDVMLENRLSFGDDYATIRETPAASEQPPSNDASGMTATYEDVQLGDIAPPLSDKPPRLPSDSLTRPPRHPITENTDTEPPYAESMIETRDPQPSDDVFLPSTGTSSSVRIQQTTALYAQTELVPRSQSARNRSHSDNIREPMVELGSPGIKKPSVRIPGSQPTVLDIPDRDEDDNPDYESVLLQNASEAPDVKTSLHSEGETENAQSGWVDNTIYISVDDPNRRSVSEDEDSPELVTYEQTNFVRLNSTNTDLIEEDDYEEIRRSRLTENEDDNLPDQTTTQTIDGKDVPVTEL